MDLDEFVSASHVLVTPSGMDLGVIDGWLSLHGRTRSVAVVINHFADALRIVAGSNLLTCVPKGFVGGHGKPLATEHGLVVRDLPFETEKLVYKLVWHERVNTHPAHQWFRSLVSEVCGTPSKQKGILVEQ
jgi:DNA-binding transcriptional LysR family regulator